MRDGERAERGGQMAGGPAPAGSCPPSPFLGATPGGPMADSGSARLLVSACRSPETRVIHHFILLDIP